MSTTTNPFLELAGKYKIGAIEDQVLFVNMSGLRNLCFKLAKYPQLEREFAKKLVAYIESSDEKVYHIEQNIELMMVVHHENSPTYQKLRAKALEAYELISTILDRPTEDMDTLICFYARSIIIQINKIPYARFVEPLYDACMYITRMLGRIKDKFDNCEQSQTSTDDQTDDQIVHPEMFKLTLEQLLEDAQ
jgi:hypothetical protein